MRVCDCQFSWRLTETQWIGLLWSEVRGQRTGPWTSGRYFEKGTCTHLDGDRETLNQFGFIILFVELSLMAGLNKGSTAAVSGKWHRERHLFTWAAPLSVPLVRTSANSAAQCRYDPTRHALFFQAARVKWPIRAVIVFTSDEFLLLVSRANSAWVPISICVVIGCRLPGAGEITRVGSAFCHWPSGGWRPHWPCHWPWWPCMWLLLV